MVFTIIKSIEILKTTPNVLESLLKNLSDDWINSNEGERTWSPYEVIGHLIHGERTDWIARLEIVISNGNNKTFTPFDRFAQFEESKGKSLGQLLEEFKKLRMENLNILKSKNLTEKDFERTGIHPDFGTVTLKNLIATWAVHDLNHISQIARVMSYQYKEEVGPWKKYLRILN